jgi:hypothetical protein
MNVSLIFLPMLLTACATMPNGPSTMALPGTGKSFDQFRADDAMCRQYAQSQIGGTTANQSANESFAKSAAVGTALGAAVGAAAGGGRGAGVGAATGLLVGSMVGVDAASVSSYGTQHRYDNAYTQCMYASGHRVAVSGRVVTVQQPAANVPPASAAMPAPAAYPPPPPGYQQVPPDYRPPVSPDVSR